MAKATVGAMEEKAVERPGPSERLQQAAVLYKLGKFFEALELLDELAKEKPDSRHVLYSQGMCLAALGHTDDAWRACEKLKECKGSTAASLASKLKSRLEEIENRRRRPSSRRTTKVMVRGLLGMAVQPKGLLVCAILFTGTIFGLSALRVEPKDYEIIDRPLVYAAQAVAPISAEGSYLDVPTCYLAGKEDPVKFAIVFCPYPETGAGLEAMDDTVGEQVAENWAELRAQVDEALEMAVQQAGSLEGLTPAEVARVAVIPRDGLALAGGLRGRSVNRFQPGPAKTLRALAAAAGAPEGIALWTQGTALTGIEGDVCWWGRLGVATDDNGVVTHLAIIGLPVEAPPAEPVENENPEAAADS